MTAANNNKPAPHPLPAKVASPSPGPASNGTPSQVEESPNSDDLARRVAEAKKRVAVAQSKLAVKDNPYMVGFSICLQ